MGAEDNNYESAVMEKTVCPNCGEKLVVDKCLGEKDAVMKCRHCKKGFNVSFDEKTFPTKFNSFNWGAFLMGWIWCLGNGKKGLGVLLFLLYCFMNIPYIGILFSIPGLIISFWLGVRGNKIAWNNKAWKSVEEFEKAQRSWTIAGVILLSIAFIFGFFAASKF